MSLAELLGIIGFVTGATALLIVAIRGRTASGTAELSRMACQGVKADYDNPAVDAPAKYNNNATYCDWLNDSEYAAITQYCDKSECPQR